MIILKVQAVKGGIMRKTNVITTMLLLLFAMLVSTLIVSCKQAPSTVNPGPLFNESINQQIENLTKTNTTQVLPEFKEFYFNYTPRAEAKYEIARDDIFTLSWGNFTSNEISFLGVMLGDSYDSVIKRLGQPNHKLTGYNNTFSNLDYSKRIGINITDPAITFHVENDTVTRITVNIPFNKYLQGNTSVGQPKGIIYALLDVPDYQDFLTDLKVFHYVEKGVELYFPNNYVGIMSFVPPKKFKGVKYVVVQEEIGKGVYANVTKAVLIE
jgi:hypothetical protein